MNEFRADLHCHTNCSDGTATPQEIIDLACSIGLKGLSITDHDTLDAYDVAIPAAKKKNLLLISGIELSTTHRNNSVHILGYSFSLDSPVLRDFCAQHLQRRLQRAQMILDLLAKHHMPIDFSELSGTTIGRPHIAMAMVKKGYVNSLQEAFHSYLGEEKSCYVPSSSATTEETINLIHQAGGLAVIAHPHLIDDTSILRDLLEMPFDGIEGYYGRFYAHQQERWVKIGQYRKWLITGGSDFHGTIKPTLALGSSWVNEETFNILYQHFKSHNP